MQITNLTSFAVGIIASFLDIAVLSFYWLSFVGTGFMRPLSATDYIFLILAASIAIGALLLVLVKEEKGTVSKTRLLHLAYYFIGLFLIPVGLYFFGLLTYMYDNLMVYLFYR